VDGAALTGAALSVMGLFDSLCGDRQDSDSSSIFKTSGGWPSTLQM
jgi:hypothetical protein